MLFVLQILTVSQDYLKTTPYICPVLYTPDGLNCLEVLYHILENPDGGVVKIYSNLDNFFLNGSRIRKMPFSGLLVAGEEYIFEYKIVDDKFKFDFSGCNISENTLLEDGFTRVVLSPMLGSSITLKDSHKETALRYSVVKEKPESTDLSRKPIEHVPAITQISERKYYDLNLLYKRSTSLFDGFIMQNHECTGAFDFNLKAIAEYCNSLSRKENLEESFIVLEDGSVNCDFSKDGYRLPTVDEWLMALGNTKTVPTDVESFSKYAWFNLNSKEQFHATAQKQRINNTYDMLGNKAELCMNKDGNFYLMGGSSNDDLQAILKLEPVPFDFSGAENNVQKMNTIRLIRNIPKNYDALLALTRKLNSDGISDSYPDDLNLYKSFFQYLADEKYPPAMNELGVALFKGNGFTKDINKGIQYILEAAEANDKDALYNAGVFYEYNLIKNERNNMELATEYYEAAAEKGHVNAQYRVYEIYLEGNGVPQNYEKAYHWISVINENKTRNVKCELAAMLQKGFGCQKDEGMAFKLYYAEAVDNPTAKSCLEVAECYANGIGVTQNLASAVPSNYPLDKFVNLIEQVSSLIKDISGKEYKSVFLMQNFTAEKINQKIISPMSALNEGKKTFR